jgi:hypothetical protein
MASVADFEDDGQIQARDTSAGLRDHGRAGVDPGDSPMRPHPLRQATRLVPEATAHVQDLIPCTNGTGIEHPLLDLLDLRVLVDAVQPAKGCLGVS